MSVFCQQGTAIWHNDNPVWCIFPSFCVAFVIVVGGVGNGGACRVVVFESRGRNVLYTCFATARMFPARDVFWCWCLVVMLSGLFVGHCHVKVNVWV